ncbi:MAG: hypothetical protein K9L25_14100 [Methylovulum sp.]|nr:hypothetical protein [Methylovulum sp.]
MNLPSKFVISFSLIMLLIQSAHAEEKRIYQTDSLGNIQYHKPSYNIEKEGRIIETDPIGNKQYHKQQYQIKGDNIYQIDSLGNIQYHKPSLMIK